MNNKEFIKKIAAAKKMEYEAMKELLPDNTKNAWNDMENAVIELLKEAAIDFYVNNILGAEAGGTGQKTGKSADEDNDTKKTTKIHID